MTTVKTKTSVDIKRSPADVAAFLADTRNTTKWQQASGLVEISADPAGSLKMGTRLTEKRKMMGKVKTYVGEVVAFEANKTWTIRDAVNKPPKFQGVFTLAAESGGTRYTFNFNMRVPFFVKLIPCMASMMRKSMQKDANTLKALLEAQGK